MNMKKILNRLFIICSLSVVSYSYSRDTYAIINSTNYDVEIYMLWNKLNSKDSSSFYLKEVIPALGCLQIHKMYFDYTREHCEQHGSIMNCLKWVYLNNSSFKEGLKMFVNDEKRNAYDVVLHRGRFASYEVIGEKNSILGLFDDFNLITHSHRSVQDLNLDQCKVFHPEDALPIEDEHSVNGMRILWPF